MVCGYYVACMCSVFVYICDVYVVCCIYAVNVNLLYAYVGICCVCVLCGCIWMYDLCLHLHT